MERLKRTGKREDGEGRRTRRGEEYGKDKNKDEEERRTRKVALLKKKGNFPHI
jgi:hypothetical protein